MCFPVFVAYERFVHVCTAIQDNTKHIGQPGRLRLNPHPIDDWSINAGAPSMADSITTQNEVVDPPLTIDTTATTTELRTHPHLYERAWW